MKGKLFRNRNLHGYGKGFLIGVGLTVLVGFGIFWFANQPSLTYDSTLGSGMANDLAKDGVSPEFSDTASFDSNSMWSQSGSVSYDTLDFEASKDQLFVLLDTYDGRLLSEHHSREETGVESKRYRYGSYSVEVPASQAAGFLAALREAGGMYVSYENVDLQEVSDFYETSVTRKDSVDQAKQRLQELLDQTDDVDTILQIEQAMWQLDQELSYAGDTVSEIEDSVRMASFQVMLTQCSARDLANLHPDVSVSEFAVICDGLEQDASLFLRGLRFGLSHIFVITVLLLGLFGYVRFVRPKFRMSQKTEVRDVDNSGETVDKSE